LQSKEQNIFGKHGPQWREFGLLLNESNTTQEEKKKRREAGERQIKLQFNLECASIKVATSLWMERRNKGTTGRGAQKQKGNIVIGEGETGKG